jgi:hypothetical protein
MELVFLRKRFESNRKDNLVVKNMHKKRKNLFIFNFLIIWIQMLSKKYTLIF